MYYFENIKYLLLLIPIFLFLFYLYKNGGNNIYFSDIKLLKNIFNNNSIYYKLYYIVLLFIFIIFLLIFSNLIIKEQKDKVLEKGIDIQIVLDVSYSMLADDFTPNRLEVSKDIISNFIDKLSQDRLGIVVFAGKPFSFLPLNFDYEISKKIIKNISIDTINQNNLKMQGTAIGDAIVIASDGFDEKSKNREKIIILLTDGDSNIGLNPNQVVSYLKKDEKTKDIKIYTIGIGGDKEAFITTKDIFGRNVKSPVGGLNENILKSFSSDTNGKYFRASNKEILNQIFDNISNLEKKEIEREKIVIKKEKNIYLVYLLIILYFGLFILKYKKNI